jgi:hypothetical protein
LDGIWIGGNSWCILIIKEGGKRKDKLHEQFGYKNKQKMKTHRVDTIDYEVRSLMDNF